MSASQLCRSAPSRAQTSGGNGWKLGHRGLERGGHCRRGFFAKLITLLSHRINLIVALFTTKFIAKPLGKLLFSLPLSLFQLWDREQSKSLLISAGGFLCGLFVYIYLLTFGCRGLCCHAGFSLAVMCRLLTGVTFPWSTGSVAAGPRSWFLRGV